MRLTFEIILFIGMMILVYTGLSNGVNALFDEGFFWMLNVLFNPFIYVPFWLVVTLIQDICLVVGGIGVLVLPRPQVNQFEEERLRAEFEQAVNEDLNDNELTEDVYTTSEQIIDNSKIFEK